MFFAHRAAGFTQCCEQTKTLECLNKRPCFLSIRPAPFRQTPCCARAACRPYLTAAVDTDNGRCSSTTCRTTAANRSEYENSEFDDDDCSSEFSPRNFLFEEPTKYRRVMLKLSGEALQGGLGFGVDPVVLRSVARDIAEESSLAGETTSEELNAWEGLDRATADYVGMMATCMNAICLQSALESLGVPTRVQTAIEMKEIAEPYIRRKAVAHLEKGRVVIFGAGTGNPFFTTDTAAALRAAEIEADVLMKATKVDGVYDCDPMQNPNAKRYERLSFEQVAQERLGVMDETAITLCKENHIPVLVFDLLQPGNVLRAVLGHDGIGTT
eukprot:CAMPEP_0177607590 /NCGR_PEP_ID=MMETSP0419_2-20121207/18004_1 /TAXON_ID=582737 /ORGANISM="Tetraselmis sp., Strain GSL018" /LENGTH=326 /DNA_ID=CAMNT_0019102193 /DNA_START=158 /DNA_END=1135 /DNA_ORIENTATION=+